jgi:hypothetical protein
MKTPFECSMFVVFHSHLHEELYQGKENAYYYAKVGDKPASVSSAEIRNRIVTAKDLPGFVSKGKHWAESEFLFALYHTMKTDPKYLENSTHIGVTQYDHNCTSYINNEHLVDFLSEKLYTITNDVVLSLVPIEFNYEVYGNSIAMDFSDPQKQQGTPLCYFTMISNYNKYYGTSYTFSDLFRMIGKNISLCSSFVMTKENFMEMMAFCTWAADKNNLDQFDPARIWRAAGGYMERYYGCWIALSNKRLVEFPISSLPRL